MPDVLVVGGGPVGTLLAAELARRAVDVAVIERRAGEVDGSRAIGVHAPVLQALEPSGATERLLANAQRVRRGEARSAGRVLGTVRFDRLDRRFPFVATLAQPLTQAALGVGAPTPVSGHVTALRQHGGRVTATVSTDAGAREIGARIAVVAGGPRARSLVYGAAAMRARSYPDRYVMADVPAPGGELAVVHLDRVGLLESFPLPGGVRRFVAPAPPDLDDASDEARATLLRAALRARGEHEGADAVVTASWFSIRRALARRMRRDRLLVIGDAAHEVSPMGGQGMNLGLLDAATLAPLLAQWVRDGEAPEPALRAWEKRRRSSARAAGAISSMNTVLGRPASAAADAARRAALRVALATPVATLFAHAYAMGFDADA